MNFSCDNCQRWYTIADEKVRGRQVRVKCKACNAIITVGPLEEAAPAPQEERTRMVAVDDLERLKAQAAGRSREPRGEAKQSPWEDEPTRAVPPEEAGALWFAMLKGVQEGPYDTSALRGRIFAGDIGPKTYVWKNGMADWKRAADLSDLAALMKPAPQSRAAKKTAIVKPPPPEAPGISVTASQILDTSEVERAVHAAAKRSNSGPPTRKSTAELNAKELFADLELSKIVKNPLLQQPLDIPNEPDALSPPDEASPPEGPLLDSEVRTAERPAARDTRRQGNGLRKVLAAALVILAVGAGVLGAARMGLLPGRGPAVASGGGAALPSAPKEATAAPDKADPPVQPAKATVTGKPAATHTAAAGAKEKGAVEPAVSSSSEPAKEPQPGETAAPGTEKPTHETAP